MEDRPRLPPGNESAAANLRCRFSISAARRIFLPYGRKNRVGAGVRPRHAGTMAGPLLKAVSALAGVVRIMARAVRTRRALQKFNNHMMHDIGLDLAEAEREEVRPFWRKDLRL